MYGRDTNQGAIFIAMHKVFINLAVEVGLEGALLMNVFFMDAMASDSGQFTEPVKDILTEFPYLSYRKVHRGIRSVITNGYVRLVCRNHEGKFVYELTKKGYDFFFENVAPAGR